MPRLFLALNVAFLCALAPLGHSAEPVSVAIEGDAVTARNVDRMLLWRVRPADVSSVFIRALPNGRIDLGNGILLSAQGRLLARGAQGTQPSDSAAAQSSPTWSPFTVIDASVSQDFPAPIFDPQGNAWVVTQDNGGKTVTAIESNGVSGTWQAPQILMGPGLELEGLPAMSIDTSGIVHVVCRNISSNHYQILYTSHAPGGVWQTPKVIYTSPYFFQNLSIATDSAGDSIVVFDRASATNGLPQGWSVVYSQSTGSAGTGQMISPAGQSFYLQSLANSPNGGVVFLVYTGSLGAGLYYQVFDPNTLTWQTARPISGTKLAAVPLVGVGARYPLTVDALGNATLIAPYYTIPFGNYYSLEGLRYEQGSWNQRSTLIPWGPAAGDGGILDTGSIAQNSQGDSIAVGGAYTSTSQIINAYRYTNGSGWDVEVVAQQSHNFSSSHLGVAWFGSSGEAVASYFAGSLLNTTMYISGSWSYSPAVPGPYEFGEDPLTAAPTGEVLLTPLSPSGFAEAALLR